LGHLSIVQQHRRPEWNETLEPILKELDMSQSTISPRFALAPGRTAFLFDLDGTLVDSVYQHVLAWHEAMTAVGIKLAVWTIHRRIGMSGGLMANAIVHETGHPVPAEQASRLVRFHAEAYARLAHQVRPLPGARELLNYLSHARVPWAIATSGKMESARPALETLGILPEVPIVTRDQVAHAKPDPDLFLTAAERLGVAIEDSVVVGDSVWDLLAARRARALSVGLLSGGYGQDELERAGAYRVYQDPADLSGIWMRSASARRNELRLAAARQVWGRKSRYYR
jgi:HAD superfamily hydrolase (TIGR01509 family)